VFSPALGATVRASGDTEEPQTIESYLRELDAALSGPGHWRRRVIDETEDFLRCDLDETPSERAVLERWGSVQAVAAGFNETGRLLSARRMAWQILQWLPILIVGWALVVELSPDPFPHETMLIRWVAPMLFASVVVACIGSAQLIRSVTSRRAEPVGAATACGGVVSGVICIVALLINRLDASHWHIFWPAAAGAGMITVGLLVAVIRNARHLIKGVAAR
jgi:hypothetical protein